MAVIKINIDNSARLVSVVGIIGDELHKVTCIRASNHDIPVTSGECGSEVQKTFGIQFASEEEINN